MHTSCDKHTSASRRKPDLSYNAVLIEGNEDQKEILYGQAAAFDGDVSISWGFADADESILKRLAAVNAKKDADVLKLDIDSYDRSLMEVVLDEGYAPKVLMVEFMPDIPPPIVWYQKFTHLMYDISRCYKNSNRFPALRTTNLFDFLLTRCAIVFSMGVQF